MLRVHLPVLATVLAAGAYGAGSTPPSFTIEGIGALEDLTDVVPTPPTSFALAINDDGLAGGGSWVSGGAIWLDQMTQIAEPITTHAVLWQDGILEDLGVLGRDAPPDEFPRPSAHVKSINALGQAVGDADVLDDGWWHVLLYLPEPAYGLPAGMNEVPPISQTARAWAINDSGVIAGESKESEASLVQVAVLWTPADGDFVITNIGSAMGGTSSVALGINALGQATGWLLTGPPLFDQHAFLYLPEPAYGLPAGGNLISEGFPGSVGNDINDLGQIVGRGPGWSPMIWLPEPAYGLETGFTSFPVETMFDQETLDAHGLLWTGSAEFMAIGGGIAVGNATFAVELPTGDIGSTSRGFAWIDGTFHLLDALRPSSAPWSMIVFAEDVNASRQIAGTGVTVDGDYIGYVMTPRLPGDVDGDGDVDFADLVALLAQWGPCPPPPANCAADVDGDGAVGFADLLVILTNWT